MSVSSFTQSYKSYTSSMDSEQSAQDFSMMDPQVSPHEMISKLEGSDDVNELEHDKFVLLSEMLERFRPDDEVSEEWVVTFIEDGGVETLVNQLLNLALRYDLADMTIFASLVPLSVCLRALSSYPSFLQYFLENDSDEVRETLANILKSGSMMCRREVVLLLTNLMLEESSSMEFVRCTYDLVSEIKGFTFFPLMRDFETQTSDSDYITDIFAFINAYILCESTFEKRMKAREEFTSFGLLDIIQNQEFKDLLSSSDTQSATALKIQLDFFTQQMADDEAMALQPVHAVITQLSNTEVFSQTKVILQNLLEIYECHHDDFDDNLVQRIFDMLQKLLMDLSTNDDPETIMCRFEAAPLEANSAESLKVNFNSLANFSFASKMENFSNNKRVNLPPVYQKNRGNSYPIDKRCFSETCLHDRTLSLPTSLRCTVSDVDDVIRIRHWSHNELYNNRQQLAQPNEHDTSFMTVGSSHNSTEVEIIVEKSIALNPYNDDPVKTTNYERIVQAMDRMVSRNSVFGHDSRDETATSNDSTPFSLISEEIVNDGPRNDRKDSREQRKKLESEPSKDCETSLEPNSLEFPQNLGEEPCPEVKLYQHARPLLKRSPSINEFSHNDLPDWIENETVALFHPQIAPISCKISMTASDTLVENKACTVEVTQRSFGSAALCCNGGVMSYTDEGEENHPVKPIVEVSEKVLRASSALDANDCATQTDQSDQQFMEKECQTAPYLPPRGSKFPDKQISFKDSTRSDIESKRKEFGHIFYQSLRSPSSLRFKVPTCFQELNNMNSPFTSTPSGSPSMRRSGDKESVIVSRKLKEMKELSPVEPRNKIATNMTDRKKKPSRSDLIIPVYNQKHLPLPFWKHGEQGTLRVHQTFTPTDVDTSYGPLVEERDGYWIKNTRSVYPENSPSTPGASSTFDGINFRYPDYHTNKKSLSPNYSPRISERGPFDRRRHHKQSNHESNCTDHAQRRMFESRESEHVNIERPPSLVPSRGRHINVYRQQYHEKPVLTKAVNDCFYLIRNTEASTLLNCNDSQQNHINLQSKENLKVTDFSANCIHDQNTSKLPAVNEHLPRLSGSCSISSKIIAPIKSYPLWSREEVKLDDAMLITTLSTVEGKPHKKKGPKSMLSKVKKSLKKGKSGSKSNFGSIHNLQQQQSQSDQHPASSNASSSVAPSSELSRSSYVPSDDDKISIHYASLGRDNRKPRYSYHSGPFHRTNEGIPETLPHHASQPISNAYMAESPISQQNSLSKKKKANELSSKERRSSFSKLKNLFTARPEAESSSKLYGRTSKSKSTKGIQDISTMSQPFYNPGIDDLTIVKENDSCVWNAVNDESQDVIVNDANDKQLAIPPSHQSYQSLKGRSTQGEVGAFQGLKELPETDL